MLKNHWYPIVESVKLKRKPLALKRLGQQMVLWRRADGVAVAQGAYCPHRGASLAQGKVVADQLICPWHGFEFNDEGACQHMPCAGHGSERLALTVYEIREAHGLIWYWYGDNVAEAGLPELFDEADDLRNTAQASYVLPHHYSRMVETNFDIHHTPFVHASVVPGVGALVQGFEVEQNGDEIKTWGRLCKNAEDSGLPFRAVLKLPCLSLVALTPKLRIVVSSTPIDDNSTWLWFRYYQDYSRLPGLQKWIAQISVWLERYIVQPQDWRLFDQWHPGTIDQVPYRFVDADKGIALYRKLRQQKLQAQQLKTGELS